MKFPGGRYPALVALGALAIWAAVPAAWYTNELLTSTGSYNNRETYITSFKFPSSQ